MSTSRHFLSLPNAPVTEAEVLILPVPLERIVSFKPGTSAAPTAILETSAQLEFYEEDAGWSPFKHLKVSVLPEFGDDGSLSDKEWHSSLADRVAALPKDKLLITLGGEHSLTPSLVAARMETAGTILYLDAHAGMRRSDKGSHFSHACPATRLLEQGHSLVLAGIRSVFEEEVELVAQEPRISLFMDWDLRGKGQWEALLQRIRSIQGPVYLSIDMDVFSPALVPGVCTPQPGGFFWYQMIEVLEALFAKRSIELLGVDIVGMVPEPSRISEMATAKLVHKIISFWGLANSFHRKPQAGSQMQINYE